MNVFESWRLRKQGYTEATLQSQQCVLDHHNRTRQYWVVHQRTLIIIER
jgi:hypothetical protein